MAQTEKRLEGKAGWGNDENLFLDMLRIEVITGSGRSR